MDGRDGWWRGCGRAGSGPGGGPAAGCERAAERAAGGTFVGGAAGYRVAMANAIDVQKYLSGVDYPADRAALVEHARGQDAPDDVVELLEGIEDREYEGPSGVSGQLGGKS